MADIRPAGSTRHVADFISSLRYEVLPAHVVDVLKRLIMDGVANIVAGGALAPGRLQTELFTGFGGNPEATVLATGRRLPLPHATYLNSTHANLLDFDDTYKALLHPGATAIAPALAVGEYRRASGRAVMAAVAAAYEVAIRIAEGGAPTPERNRQVWGLGTWQTLGAAAASASLLGLDRTTTQHALGLAAFNAPVPSVRKLGHEPEARPLAWAKNNYGWASMGGVLGTLSAARGFRGSTSVLDGPQGFWVQAGSDQNDEDTIVDGLGSRFRFAETSLKPYAACRWNHSSLDCLRQLRAARELPAPDEIESITIHGFRELVVNCAHPHPQDIIDAQFSLPHLLALEVLGRSSATGLREEDLADPVVRDLASRVHLVRDPAADENYLAGSMSARACVRSRNGTAVEATVLDPWGSPANPFSDEDLLAKTRALLEPALGPQRARILIDGIFHLEKFDDITDLLHPVWTPRTA